MLPTIRRATSDDLSAAASTLADAFQDYPWTRWTVDPSEHSKRIHTLQYLYLNHLVLPAGDVWVSDDLSGVIALVPPNAGDSVTPAIWNEIAQAHGTHAERVHSVELPTCPDPSAWSLATFGVASHCQGRGVGQALLHHALTVFDAEVGAAIHCETSDARNVTLYERHGWDTTDTTYISDGPAVWSMLRSVGGASRR